ncbi:MAG: serine hydrolase [Armatimonadia bacterium]|nr:serine hydrolase [Armatimonadia bacterium]
MSLSGEVIAAIEDAIDAGVSPGAVCIIGRGDETLCHEAVGDRALKPQRLPMEPDTVFDAASVTKPVATTTVVMALAEDGVLSVDDPVSRWLPEFTGEGRAGVTVRHLLTHTSGLPAYRDYPAMWGDEVPPEERRARVVADLAAGALAYAPGEDSVYSCLGFILLASVVEAASGRPLAELADERVFGPLGMRDSCFCPPPEMSERCAATEELPEGVLQGVVHDQNARYLGGVGGNAGLFTTAGDLARFARAILRGGELDGARVLGEDSVEAVMTEYPAPGEVRRTLGWRLANSSDVHLHGAPAAESVGHTGFTGTCLWVDPASGLYVILLTNRVHMGRDAEIEPLRRRVGEIAAGLV